MTENIDILSKQSVFALELWEESNEPTRRTEQK